MNDPPKLHVGQIKPDFESWRAAAREFLMAGIEPGRIAWSEETSPLLFAAQDDAGAERLEGGAAPAGKAAGRGAAAPTTGAGAEEQLRIAVPRRFFELARLVACHRDAERWPLLYRVLWRIAHGERRLLEISVDEDVQPVLEMERQVRRDRHKMTAFVRFREVADAGGVHYVAWHEPDHHIVELTAPFFAKRFAAMRWSILTPDVCAHWDCARLVFTPGLAGEAARKARQMGDALEVLWRAYYASIFNPARVKVEAMKKEMPVRYWKNLPETQEIAALLHESKWRVAQMKSTEHDDAVGAERFIPKVADARPGGAGEEEAGELRLRVLREAVQRCEGCALCGPATQAVFGEGAAGARGMMVGEQPGDEEDVRGRPFVGPAGRLLDELMEAAAVERGSVYVTNTVKHFKFEPRGHRRIHAKPSARESAACVPWLWEEIRAVRPRAILCLGATAAQALLGRDFRMMRGRGVAHSGTRHAPWVMGTWHPSALLRMPDPGQREEAKRELIADLAAFKAAARAE